MKLHDLRPAAGSNTARTRVGRGIAAGKGKTAGRGTKGQKARAGGSIPPWFEGGQTPLHMRIPKLRGFKNRAKIEYEIVNVGDIAARVDAGAFATAGATPKKGEQLTINAETLRAVGLVRDIRKPLKVLGGGDLSNALFVVADAFTKSAVSKIEGAGGAVSVLEVPARSIPAIGLEPAGDGVEERAPKRGQGKQPATGAARARGGTSRTTTSGSPAAAPTSGSRTKDEPVAQAAAEAVDAEPAMSADAPGAADEAATATADDSPAAADGPSVDESVDAPDAVTDIGEEAPLPGDDSETDSVVPGDDA
jgi:large subunit ribosomal protein L15